MYTRTQRHTHTQPKSKANVLRRPLCAYPTHHTTANCVERPKSKKKVDWLAGKVMFLWYMGIKFNKNKLVMIDRHSNSGGNNTQNYTTPLLHCQ